MVWEGVSYAMFQRGQSSLVQIPLRQGRPRKSLVLRCLEEGICGGGYVPWATGVLEVAA
jgi:hypothetical protein